MTGRPGDEWRREALCAEVDPELFFPEVGANLADPRLLCRRCRVTADCLAWALDNPRSAEFGMWGGLTARERRALRQRQRDQAAS